MDRLYVIAERYDHAADFARQMKVPRSHLRYISCAEHIRGLDNISIYRLRGWRHNERASKIMDVLITRRNIDLKDV